jgi:hypothetical protein
MKDLNERKLFDFEQKLKDKILDQLKDKKREFVSRYGKDTEKVMYGRAINKAKKKTQDILKKIDLQETIKKVLSNDPIRIKK